MLQLPVFASGHEVVVADFEDLPSTFEVGAGLGVLHGTCGC